MVKKKCRYRSAGWVALILLGVLSAAALGYAHGGKGHGAGEFTHLDALKKATELYDKLIETGKLDSGWETGLQQVVISERRKGEAVEKVVSFSRMEGDPKAVFIFFNAEGKYAGSNFTGQ